MSACTATFFLTGTTAFATIYADGTLTTPLANPLTSDASGTFVAVYLNPATIYRVQIKTSTGVLISDTDPYISGAAVVNPTSIGPVLYPQTPAEIAASVTPANFIYTPGDLRRYGAVGGPSGACPSTDDSVPWASAVKTGYAVVPQGMAFKVVTGTTFTGQVTILGSGQTSQLYCDSLLVTVTGGNSSVVDNVYLANITAPYIVTRNPANWAAVISPIQSNGLGYQPTVNDPEYATWVAAQPLVGTQNIGPTILFQGIASDITVSRIYGRFVNIRIMDAQNSTVRDCDYQGGKYIFAALVVDNCTNNLQPGQNNQAINNRIGYASSCGIRFFSNVDFTYRGIPATTVVKVARVPRSPVVSPSRLRSVELRVVL
jgi:hypothetical protein